MLNLDLLEKRPEKFNITGVYEYVSPEVVTIQGMHTEISEYMNLIQDGQSIAHLGKLLPSNIEGDEDEALDQPFNDTDYDLFEAATELQELNDRIQAAKKAKKVVKAQPKVEPSVAPNEEAKES